MNEDGAETGYKGTSGLKTDDFTRGWGKVILEIVVLLVGMTFWFSRLESKVDKTIEWMVHHIEAEHKERAVMHHRRMEDIACMECKGIQGPKQNPFIGK